MLDFIAQIGMPLFGLPAIFLVAKKNKWGFVLGLISQPFFFITSVVNHQWGLLFMSTLYTLNWIYGIYIWFYKEKYQKSVEA